MKHLPLQAAIKYKPIQKTRIVILLAAPLMIQRQAANRKAAVPIARQMVHQATPRQAPHPARRLPKATRRTATQVAVLQLLHNQNTVI